MSRGTMKSFVLHYHDGRKEHRTSYDYSEDLSRVYFHQREDQSDHDSWVERALLIMIEDEEGRAKSVKPGGVDS